MGKEKDCNHKRDQEKVQNPKEKERDIPTREFGTTLLRVSRDIRANAGTAGKLAIKEMNAERRFKPLGTGKRLEIASLNRGKKIRFASGGPPFGFRL